MIRIEPSRCPKHPTRVHLRLSDGPDDDLRHCGHLCVQLETYDHLYFALKTHTDQEFGVEIVPRDAPKRKEQTDEPT
jgi:hypothetical protein